jgi:hypothetical protein
MAEPTPKKPRKKRKPRAKLAPPPTDWMAALKFLGDHIISVVGVGVVICIIAFIILGKISEKDRLAALGSIPIVMGAAQKLEFEMRMRQQTTQLNAKTDAQTATLESPISTIHEKFNEWKDWQMGSGDGNVSGNGGTPAATGTDASAANREAKKAWIQSHPKSDPSA